MSTQYNIKVDLDLATADQKIASITRAIAAIGATNGGGAPGLSSIRAQLDQIIATNPSVAAVIRSLGQTGQSASAAAHSLHGTGAAASSTATAFGTLGQSVAVANSRLAGLNGSLGSLALAGASTAVLAVAGAFAFGVKAASDYADKLAEISTLVDTTKFNMAALSDGLKKQAEIYGQSPIAQAGAAYDIISSGASSAADAISTLNAANLLAAVGATNVGVAANGLTSVLNAFASQSLTATQAADSMFITVRDGKITMEQLAASIGNVAPVAATLGLSLDDVGASIAALTLGGVQGSEAVTNIRAALTAIIKPSSEASKLAKQIGLDFSSSALKSKGWAAFLTDVKDKTHGSVDELAVLMGGVEGLNAVLALTTTGNASFTDSLDHMKDKAGVAADALKKVQDASPGFQMGRVMAAIRVEAINLGQGFISVLVPSLKFVADHFRDGISVAKALAATFIVFKGLSIAATFFETASAFQLVGKAATALNTIIKGAALAQQFLNSVILANPFVAAAAAITGIVTLLYEFRDSISLGGGSMASLGDLFRAIWESFGPIVSGVINGITAGFSTAYGAVSGFLGGVANVAQALGAPFVAALDTITALFSSAFGDLDLSISGILIGAARTVDGMVGLFRGGWAAIVALWNGLPAAIGPSFQSFLASAKSVVMAIGSGIVTAYNAVVSFSASCAASVAAVFNAIFTFIETWVNKAIGGINTVLAGANKLGANLGLLSDVKLGTITAPTAAPSGFQKLGQSMGAAFQSGFGHEAENGIRGLLARADAIGKGRNATSASAAANGARLTSSGGGLPDKPTKEKADPEAKKLAERLKKEREYFQQLDATAQLAAMLPQDAERYNKELELRKIRGDGELKDSIQLSNVDKERIANALKLKDTNELIRDIQIANMASDVEALHIKDKITATAGVSAAKAAENLAVEEKLWPFKEDALKKGISLADVELQKQLAILDAKERQNYQAEHANQLAQEAISNGVDYGKNAIADYGVKAAKIALATTTRDKTLANLNAAKSDGKLDIDGFNAGVKKAGADFKAAVDAAAESWANKLGTVLNKIGDMTGGKVGDVINGAGSIATSIGDFTKNAQDVSKGITSLFSDPNSDLAKGVGKNVGSAVAGLGIGESIGKLGTALGLKHGETGASIGGAVGGLAFGPLGAAIGGVLGSILGSLFYKPKYGTASLTNGSDSATVTGTSKTFESQSASAAGQVQAGLQSIAKQLGGTVGSFSLAIGQFDGKWRVNDAATSKSLNFNNFTDSTLHDFGTEGADAAIAYAVGEAVKQGAITGLSGTLQRALSVLGTDAAISFAQSWASAMDDYDAILDPVASAIKAVNDPIDALKATLVSIGDTAADQAKLEGYRQAKLAQVMKAQTKTFTDLLDSLNGASTGTTALNVLNNDMAKFAGFQTDIKAGKQVNQDDFSTLINKLITENAAVYGTSTKQAQANTQAFRDAVTAAQQLVLNEFNTGSTTGAANDNNDTTSAITNGTSVVAAGIASTNAAMTINNSYQAQILAAVQNLASGEGSGNRTNSRADQV